METDDRLKKTTFEVLQLCLSAMVEHPDLHKPSHEDLISDPAMLSCWPTARAYGLANSVLEIIKPSPISNPSDLFRIVTDEFVAELNENQGGLSPRWGNFCADCGGMFLVAIRSECQSNTVRTAMGFVSTSA